MRPNQIIKIKDPQGVFKDGKESISNLIKHNQLQNCSYRLEGQCKSGKVRRGYSNHGQTIIVILLANATLSPGL